MFDPSRPHHTGYFLFLKIARFWETFRSRAPIHGCTFMMRSGLMLVPMTIAMFLGLC